MKKVLVTLATVAGFLGLSGIILYFVMSPSQGFALPGFTLPGTALTADIGANFFGGTPATPADSPDQPTAQPTAPTTDNATATADAVIATPAPAPSPEDVQPAPTPQPVPPTQDNTADFATTTDLPVATATITVTPTAPPAPPLAPLTAQPAPSTSATTSTADSNPSLPFTESNFSGDTNWQTSWGIVNITPAGSLQLAAGANSFGGAVYLTTGIGWKDYSMNVTLDPVAGKTFALMADYKDASNYVFCEYTVTGTSTATMQLLQYAQGYKNVLSPSVTVPWSNGTDVNAAIGVTGVHGTCSLGGQSVSNDDIGPEKVAMAAAGSGSIGIAIDDASPNTGQVVIKSVNVIAQ